MCFKGRANNALCCPAATSHLSQPESQARLIKGFGSDTVLNYQCDQELDRSMSFLGMHQSGCLVAEEFQISLRSNYISVNLERDWMHPGEDIPPFVYSGPLTLILV